ncbi:helix-turn-helix domain-containing protein [Arenibacterium halophilum]|nr:helix-turn-helix domain-containing protein [Arenibacterium halophilum]
MGMAVHEIVEAMRPAEAIDYLLSIIEASPAVAPQAPDPTAAFELTERQRRFLRALMAAGGRAVTYEALSYACYFDAPTDGDVPSDATLRYLAGRVRKQLPASFGQIVNLHGVGYRFQHAG